MPKVTRNKDLEEHYFTTILDRLDKDRDRQIHLSDLEGCMEKSRQRRVVRPYPRMDNQGTLRIMRGIAVEDFMTRDTWKPVVRDDVMCSIDDFQEPHGIVEIKATIKSKKNFKPLTTYPWWITRCKGYAYAKGVNHVNLCVVHMVWYRGTEEDINCYRIEFTDQELEENWAGVLERRDIFSEALDTHTVIPPDWVLPHKFGGNRNECGSCEWKGQCYWVKDGHAYARGINV